MAILKLTNAHDGETIIVFPGGSKVHVRESVETVLKGIPYWNEVFPKADDVSRET